MPLLLLFIVMPVLEMWLLIKVGQQIGATATIGFVLLTAAVGYALLKQQGFATLFRARQKLDSGELPAREMAEALILAISGALLLTPGFVTDVIGFSGLVPGIRSLWIKRAIANMHIAAAGSFSTYEVHRGPQQRPQGGQGSHQKGGSQGQPTTLEGEFWREDENDDKPER